MRGPQGGHTHEPPPVGPTLRQPGTEISWLGQEWRGWRLSGVPCPYGSVRVASLKLYTLREEIVTANTRQQWVVILSVPTRLALLAAQPREEELPAIVATVKHETQIVAIVAWRARQANVRAGAVT